MIRPSKPCKYCGNTGHFPSSCIRRPRVRKPCSHCGSELHERINCSLLKQLATKRTSTKATLKWASTRRAWFAEHPAESYLCYICEAYMPRAETTLDHVRPRSSNKSLRYELSNLEPACIPCQGSKGSKSLAYYIAERDKQGMNVSPYARLLAARIVGDVSAI